MFTHTERPGGQATVWLPPTEDYVSPACYDSSGKREHMDTLSCLFVCLQTAMKSPGI